MYCAPIFPNRERFLLQFQDQQRPLPWLAAPLMGVVGIEGGGFHVHGCSSKGKTTALQVAASVCGKVATGPGEDSYLLGGAHGESWCRDHGRSRSPIVGNRDGLHRPRIISERLSRNSWPI